VVCFRSIDIELFFSLTFRIMIVSPEEPQPQQSEYSAKCSKAEEGLGLGLGLRVSRLYTTSAYCISKHLVS